jgi:hypothetical protein
MEYTGIKEIALKVRNQLKREFPKATFSVTIQRYSMGQSLHVSLMKAPFDVFRYDISRFNPTSEDHKKTIEYLQEKGYAQLNQYQLRDEYDEHDPFCNGTPLTHKAWTAMRRTYAIIGQYHWDKSDIQTDYFNCNFYMHLNIGHWNKPFENTQKNVSSPISITNMQFSKKTDKRTAKVLSQILS